MGSTCRATVESSFHGKSVETKSNDTTPTSPWAGRSNFKQGDSTEKRGATRLELRVPAGNKQRMAVLQNAGQWGQWQSLQGQRGDSVAMAQLVKEQAVGSVFVAGKEPLPCRMTGRVTAVMCRLRTRLAVVRVPVVHHTVPKAQALRPQEGQHRQHNQQT